MSRYRIVTLTTAGGSTEEHVSSVVMTQEEAIESLEVEEQLALATGWHVIRLETLSKAPPTLHLWRNDKTRTLRIRESGPFDDEIA